MENQEQEKLGKLMEFRNHIKRLRNKFGEKDATLYGVEDADELNDDDMNIWEEYKKILSIMCAEATAPLKDLLSEVNNIIEKVLIEVNKAAGSPSRSWFLNWMRNRLVIKSDIEFSLETGEIPKDIKDELLLEKTRLEL